MKSNISEGCLYVVATPIGHLQDLSRRAEDVLRHVDGIVCENTRNSQKLLQHYGIDSPCVGKVTDHQGWRDVEKIVDRIISGVSLAYISDAGTPGVSDPGATLVDCAHSKGVKVVPVPGPSAVTTALSVAGFSATAWGFLGFFPEKGGPRAKMAQAIKVSSTPVVFFESPHRIEKTLQALIAGLEPERKICIVREVTKMFEQVWRGTIQELAQAGDSIPVKGEFTVVVEGQPAPERQESEVGSVDGMRVVQAMVHEGLSAKEIATILHDCGAGSKNKIYQCALAAMGKG